MPENPLLKRLAGVFRGKREAHEFYREGLLGTSFEFKAWGCSVQLAETAEEAAVAEIDRLEQIFSIYQPDSELNRFFGSTDWLEVSPELAEVLDLAESWRVKTEGAFNPAAQSILEHLKESEDAKSVSSEPNWEVDLGQMKARLLTSHRCSLNAIAKGWIVDRAASIAAEYGLSDILINIGGDLRFWGDVPHLAAVTDPTNDAENAPPISVVELRNEGLATSGGYRRGIERDGQRISHLMDPLKGTEARGVLSATVVAPSAMIADVVATALTVFEPEKGLEFAASHNCRCLVIDSSRRIFKCSGWDHRTI